MRVLITGALGFVGRHLADLCASAGAMVVGCGRDTASRASLPPSIREYVAADLSDAAQASEAIRSARPKRVFHLAASASVAASWSEPRVVLANNLSSTANVLEAVAEAAPEARMLVACSGEQYGPVPVDRLPVTEEQPLRPQSPYAVSKASADLLAGFYADAHRLQVLRTRAFNHAGPGQAGTYVVSSFARQIAAAEAAGKTRLEVVTGNVSVRRDFTDVRDVVRAYWLVLERGVAGEVYNVCRGEPVAITDILAGLGAHSKLEVAQRTEPSLVRAHDVMEVRASHSKLTEVTGWTPEIALERTLRDTLDWWRDRSGNEALR